MVNPRLREGAEAMETCRWGAWTGPQGPMMAMEGEALPRAGPEHTGQLPPPLAGVLKEGSFEAAVRVEASWRKKLLAASGTF